MNISIRNLSFSYSEKPLFNNFCVDFFSNERALVIMGPSGSGKTTLLKLLGGLLTPNAGEIHFSNENAAIGLFKTAFIFQESRLLPWLNVLENVSLPLRKIYGIEDADIRARHFLSLVSLDEKVNSYPNELSGGQAQRVSMARAFAWPAPALFMDEPFQSLDIPLRINLMENCLSLLEKENRFLIAVTHDPREAVYMGGRIVVLGKPGEGIVFDENVNLGYCDRSYGSANTMEMEREIIKVLGNKD